LMSEVRDSSAEEYKEIFKGLQHNAD